MCALLIENGLLPAEFMATPTNDGDEDFLSGTVVVDEGRIRALYAPGDASQMLQVDQIIDATDLYVLPGFIDVHVHGGDGRDTMDADPAALTAMARFFARHGVTGFLATTMTAPLAAIEAAVTNVATFVAQPNAMSGARLLGVHLEGPFISPEFPGAQSPADIRPPSVDEFVTLAQAGPARMLTLAPEQPGGHALVRAAVDAGIVAVIGHSSATYDECLAAVDLGLSQATHTYNAMTGLHHRQPGTLGAVLTDDRIFAQLIADNVHVHPAAMAVLARCKGPERIVLITDAMRAAGLPPGEYDLGGQTVTVRDGQCRLAGGTLAGSVLTMERALTNFMAASGWSLAQAWPTSSRTPAASLGLAHELGSIRPGYLADLVLLDQALEVAATIVNGEVVYRRDGAQ